MLKWDSNLIYIYTHEGIEQVEIYSIVRFGHQQQPYWFQVDQT
jgi:hypothetical protein